jgi:site-specific DNA recombinase
MVTPSRAPHTRRTRVVGYIRVSTEEQAREGVSLAAQRARIEAQAIASDLDLITVYEDAGVSAKSLVRPGLRAALDALDAGRADGLLTFKLDRLTRSVRDLGALLDDYFRERFALLSVSDAVDTRTAGGRLVLNVLTSVAEWEREAIGERTRVALAHLKSQGVRLGRVPLEAASADGAQTLTRARQLRADGATLRQIAATLTTEGRRTSRGGRWAPETVRLLLARAA